MLTLPCCHISERKIYPRDPSPPRSLCLLFTPAFSGSGPLAQKPYFLIMVRSGKQERWLQVTARKMGEGTKFPAVQGCLIRLPINLSGALSSQARRSSAE